MANDLHFPWPDPFAFCPEQELVHIFTSMISSPTLYVAIETKRKAHYVIDIIT